MNIVLPHEEYQGVFVEEYLESESNGELIVYFERVNKIVVMNETMTCIWKLIISCISNESCSCLSIYDILAAIKMRFDMGLHHDDAVIVDIVEIIQELFDCELILYKEFSPHVN